MPIDLTGGPRSHSGKNTGSSGRKPRTTRNDSAGGAKRPSESRPVKRKRVSDSSGSNTRRKKTRDAESVRNTNKVDKNGLPIKVDPETGEEYVELPKSEFVGSGENIRPVLQVDDMGGLLGLDESSVKYLPGRMRKAPSREERDRLRAEYEREQIRKSKEYRDNYQQFYDDDPDNDTIDDDQ